MIRVLIVDDSAFMRKALSLMLEEDPDIQVIDTARDGQEAVEKVKQLRPDLVTLDIEMPRMDGLTALRTIMKESPVPVLMLSSLTREGAQITLEALDAGAVDFIPKQFSFVSLDITRIKADLQARIKAIARRPSPAPGLQPADAHIQPFVFRRARLIAIGISTGGPKALQYLLSALPATLPVPVVVAQHMPPHFTRSLAGRLDEISPMRVVEAEEGMVMEAGTVMIAPGGRHLQFRKAGNRIEVCTPDHPDTLHRPSVDVMFQSAARTYQGRVLGVVMTGMGSDGREGATQVRRMGGKVIAEHADSCVVYGMPRSVVEAGQSDAVVPLESLARTLTEAVSSTTAAHHRTHPPFPKAPLPLRLSRPPMR